MPSIRKAVEEQMTKLGHTQPTVSKLTGVSQSNLSRFLAGQRKRVTDPVKALCQYAEYSADSSPSVNEIERTLSQAVRRAVGDNPAAAKVLTSVLDALAPLLRDYQPSQSPILEPSNDDTRAL